MNTFVILTHEPKAKQPALLSVFNAITGYLGTFGIQAEIAGTEELVDPRANASVAKVTLIRVTIAGELPIDQEQLASDLRAFLKKAAKNANVVAGFDVYRLESTASQPATIT